MTSLVSSLIFIIKNNLI